MLNFITKKVTFSSKFCHTNHYFLLNNFIPISCEFFVTKWLDKKDSGPKWNIRRYNLALAFLELSQNRYETFNLLTKRARHDGRATKCERNEMGRCQLNQFRRFTNNFTHTRTHTYIYKCLKSELWRGPPPKPYAMNYVTISKCDTFIFPFWGTFRAPLKGDLFLNLHPGFSFTECEFYISLSQVSFPTPTACHRASDPTGTPWKKDISQGSLKRNTGTVTLMGAEVAFLRDPWQPECTM